MKEKLPISVAIIASNEQNNLMRCLTQVHNFASEIVVVFNDCRDKTVEVAHSFGAICIEHNWEGHVKQKNFALQQCTQSWILSLDADEILSSTLLASIFNFFNSNKVDNYTGAKFNRCSYFLGKWIRHGDWYPDRKLRLIKNGTGKWDGINPHDKLVSFEHNNICTLIGDLLHYSHPNLRSLHKKSIIYSDIYIQNKTSLTSQYPPLYCSVLRSCWRFFRCFFLRLGFMDGSVGFIIALNVASETLLRHGRVWEKHNSLDVINNC